MKDKPRFTGRALVARNLSGGERRTPISPFVAAQLRKRIPRGNATAVVGTEPPVYLRANSRQPRVVSLIIED